MLGVCGVEIARRPVKDQGEPLAFDGDEPAVIAPLGRARLRLGQGNRVPLAERERGIDDLMAAVHDAHKQRGAFGCSLAESEFQSLLSMPAER